MGDMFPLCILNAGKRVDPVARNYAALPHEYLEEMDILSDAEFGRLCRALLKYSMTGEEVQLEGAEKVLLKRVYMQERRFQESYSDLTESRREAGKKGAAKRWQKKASDSKVIARDSKNAYTETETKTKTNIPPPNGGRDTPAHAKPPTLEQVMEVAKLRGCPECAKSFFDYYAAAGWRDGEGKPVYSWQQKLVAWQVREADKLRKQAVSGRKPQPQDDPNDWEGWSV